MEDGPIHGFGVDEKLGIVGILHAADRGGKNILRVGPAFFQIFFKRPQVIFDGVGGAEGVDHVVDHGLFVDIFQVVVIAGVGRVDKFRHQRA